MTRCHCSPVCCSPAARHTDGPMLKLLALTKQVTSSAPDPNGEPDDTFQVSVGHLFLLKCLFVDTHASVTWSRGGGLGPSLPPGVEVRDGLLWFLPVQMSHAGAYTCEKRDQTGSLAVTFGVSVSGGKCPDPPEKKSAAVGVTELLSCKQKEILELNHTRNIRWVKDCQLMEPPGERTSVSESGFLRLSGTSKEDSGKYTCLVDVSVDGRMYTAARSIWLAVDKDISTTLIVEPQVVYPQQEVVVVEEGKEHSFVQLSSTSCQFCFLLVLLLSVILLPFFCFLSVLLLSVLLLPVSSSPVSSATSCQFFCLLSVLLLSVLLLLVILLPVRSSTISSSTVSSSTSCPFFYC
uniref:Ig-like domain-containing protein n=1 Tax=Cyclopterus lumpus TaxID=8103 RepID=A0A8C3AJ00_CYCLU